ncbi:MAG TPA: hypothetical protein VGM82_03115 [Gemmatimonadaceae bacterium]|jgi:hypothetical protein
MSNPPADLSRKIVVRWKDIARIVAVIAALVGSIFIPPPAYMTDRGEGTLVPFARYAVAIATALFMVAMIRWNRREHLRYWIGATVAAFLLVTANYFAYNDRRDHLTAAGADGSRVVIGSEYTAVGAAYMRANPNARAEDALSDAPCPAGGGTECSARVVWTSESIASNKRLLGLLFVAGALLLDAALLSAVQCTLI